MCSTGPTRAATRALDAAVDRNASRVEIERLPSAVRERSTGLSASDPCRAKRGAFAVLEGGRSAARNRHQAVAPVGADKGSLLSPPVWERKSPALRHTAQSPAAGPRHWPGVEWILLGVVRPYPPSVQAAVHALTATRVDPPLDDLFRSLMAAPGRDACEEAAGRLVTVLGFRFFSYALPDRLPRQDDHRSGCMMLTSYPAAWQALYHRRHYDTEDPVIAYGRRTHVPFAWAAAGGAGAAGRAGGGGGGAGRPPRGEEGARLRRRPGLRYCRWLHGTGARASRNPRSVLGLGTRYPG